MRVKHKTEELYKTPAFLKRNTGISCVSACGIFETDGIFSKGYATDGMSEDEILRLCESLQDIGNDYAVILGSERKRVMLICSDCPGMTEAAVWFSELEKEWSGLTGLSAEMRLEYYCGFLSGLLGEKYHAGSFLFDTPAWKPAALLSELKREETGIRTPTGAYAVMAVRRLPAEHAKEAVVTLKGHAHVLASYAAVSGVTDEAVRVRMGEYMGLSALTSKIKRKAPRLYEAMKEDGKQAEERKPHFVTVNTYFLLQAADAEKLKTVTEAFLKEAKETGVQAEEIPFKKQKNPSELKRTIAMFGGTGNRQERYSVIIPAEKGKILATAGNLAAGEESAHEQGNDYDVEMLKALFFAEEEKE